MRFRQPSLWASSTRTQVTNIFGTGKKKSKQTKIFSGGVHKNSRRYTLSGSLWDRKRGKGKR